MGSRRVLCLTAWHDHALHEGVVAYARGAGWVLDNRMCYSGQLPTGVRADGVLCRHLFRSDIMDFTRELGVPSVGFEHADDLPLPRVYFNDEKIGRRAAQHLFVRGHKVLAFCHLQGPQYQLSRKAGFKAEAVAAGARFVELEPDLSAPARSPEARWDWLKQKLSLITMPIGIMAINDQLARTLVEALLDLGYSVPEQVAVVSAGNDPMLCETGVMPISSVETHTRQVGYEAARLLDRLMEGEPPPEKTALIEPGDVETRASTDLVAVPNLHAARALRFVWTHYKDPINVDSVSSHVTVTRRRLQTLFHNHVGRTMQEEIARVRLAEACRLLKRTSMKIHEIAAKVGFNSSLHLHRTFQSTLQMGPKAFRERGAIPDSGVLPAQVR